MAKLNSVLLVDDSKASNDLTSFHLRRNAICETIVIKNNGMEAIEFLQTETLIPDLILLDINMPVMDGFEFLESYEKLPERVKQTISILLLTSSSNPKDIERAKKSESVKGYYEKPIGKNNLLKIAENFF